MKGFGLHSNTQLYDYNFASVCKKSASDLAANILVDPGVCNWLFLRVTNRHYVFLPKQH